MKLNFCWYEKYINCEFTSIYSLRFISTSFESSWHQDRGLDMRHGMGDDTCHVSWYGL